MPNYQGIQDSSLPQVHKASLQQYDNYQIYDIFCTDSIRTSVINGSSPQDSSLLKRNFLAVQAYDVNGQIPLDFALIATTYPG